MKLTFFLRIFDQMSFLVQMLGGVFYDLRHFFMFFIIVLFFFGISIGILVEHGETDYNGFGKLYFIFIALASSVGQGEMADFNNRTQFPELTWIVWMVILVVGNIVFMNFIIAVVG